MRSGLIRGGKGDCSLSASDWKHRSCPTFFPNPRWHSPIQHPSSQPLLARVVLGVALETRPGARKRWGQSVGRTGVTGSSGAQWSQWVGVCGCVVVGEGAWLHPSDWRRLLPCLKSPAGLPYDWEREVGRFSLIRPGKRKRKKKIPAFSLDPLASQYHALSSHLRLPLSLFWGFGVVVAGIP